MSSVSCNGCFNGAEISALNSWSLITLEISTESFHIFAAFQLLYNLWPWVVPHLDYGTWTLNQGNNNKCVAVMEPCRESSHRVQVEASSYKSHLFYHREEQILHVNVSDSIFISFLDSDKPDAFVVFSCALSNVKVKGDHGFCSRYVPWRGRFTECRDVCCNSCYKQCKSTFIIFSTNTSSNSPKLKVSQELFYTMIQQVCGKAAFLSLWCFDNKAKMSGEQQH